MPLTISSANFLKSRTPAPQIFTQTTRASSLTGSSNKMIITKTDSYQTILAWKELEQKQYHPRRGGDSNSSSVLLHNNNVEKLSTWCFNVVNHFHLPLYLVEWTMNFIQRYAAAADGDNMNTTSSTLKMMTAVALRLCIRLNAGQSVYSRRHSENQQQQHMVAMMAIPHLVARQDGNNSTPSTTVIYCLGQMFVKLELVLMRALGFYLYPPLTDHYIEEIHNIVTFLASKETTTMDNNQLLEQIKTRAIMLAQAQSSLLRSSNPSKTDETKLCRSIETNKDDSNITSSSNVAIRSYLTILYDQIDIACASSSWLVYYSSHQCCHKWYHLLMDTFVDIVAPLTLLSTNFEKRQVLQERIDVMLSSSGGADDYHEDDAIIMNPAATQSYNDSSSAVLTEVTTPSPLRSHNKKRNDANCLIDDVVNNNNANHHHQQHHTSQNHHRYTTAAAAATLITTSPTITSLGKRKASPTSVIMCSNDDTLAQHFVRSSLMKK